MNEYAAAPQGVIDGIRRFADHRIPPGSFVTEVLNNNLKEAFMRADESSIAGMHAIVSYCYNEIPSVCWGSPEKVSAWLEGEEPK